MTLTFSAGVLYKYLLRKMSLLISVQFYDYITHRWLMASAQHGTGQDMGVVLHDPNKTIDLH